MVKTSTPQGCPPFPFGRLSLSSFVLKLHHAESVDSSNGTKFCQEQGHLRSPRRHHHSAGHHPGDATTLGECTPPRTGSSNNGGVRLHPSSTPPRAPPSQVDLMTPSHNREFGGSSIFGTSPLLFFYWSPPPPHRLYLILSTLIPPISFLLFIKAGP